MIMAFVIWSAVAALFLAIGIRGRKSKEAVGFFTFASPPVVTDVRKYNHAVSMIWMAAAVILEILGVPLLFSEQNSPMFLFIIFGVVVWVIGIMIAYFRVEKNYRK